MNSEHKEIIQKNCKFVKSENKTLRAARARCLKKSRCLVWFGTVVRNGGLRFKCRPSLMFAHSNIELFQTNSKPQSF